MSVSHTHAWRRVTRSIRQCATCERFELIHTPEPGTRDDDWNDDDDDSSNDEDEDEDEDDDLIDDDGNCMCHDCVAERENADDDDDE